MILLASSVFPPEPVVSATIGFDLAEALSVDSEVMVVTPKPTRPLGFLFEEATQPDRAFKHYVMESYTYPESKLVGRLRESYSFGKHVVMQIIKYKDQIDCIYIHAWPLFAPYQIVKAAKKYNIPMVIHIVDIYPEALLSKLPFMKGLVYNMLLPLDKYALQNASKVVTISPKMKTHLATSRRLKMQNVEVVYNWQNEDRFKRFKEQKRENGKSDLFTFMFLGNLSPTAAIQFLILAYKQSGINNSRLIIAGDGSQKDYLCSLSGSPNGVRVDFLDAPMDKVPEIQDMADVLLLSLVKGAAKAALPSKLPAYMFSQKPIIACVEEDSDTANIIKQANCGWVVTPEDKDAISQAMVFATAHSKEDLEQLGYNGYQYAMENFSKSGNLKKFISIIDSVKR